MVRSNLVCLFDDGRVDLRFDPGASLAGPGLNSVTGMAQQDDARILLAGARASGGRRLPRSDDVLTLT